MRVQDAPGVLSSIASIFGDNSVSIASVVQDRGKNNEPDVVTLNVVTHTVQEGKFLRAKAELETCDAVYGIDNIIRVEEEA